MNEVELSERFVRLFRTSRESKGKSQDYMAKALGVSKKTIQNIEDGTSCLNAKKIVAWFEALDEPMLPYLFQLLYPEHEGISPSSSDQEIEEALFKFIRALPSSEKRKLLYWAYGNHGSDPITVIQLMTAHLQVPLVSRINIAANVYTNYELSKASGDLVQPNHVQPNTDMLKAGFHAAKEAVLNGKKSYTL